MAKFQWRLIYQMKLGETHLPDSRTSIVRVPGGWVYSDMQGCCFIPFNNEFMEAPDEQE
jgi:hypothetical protein